MVRGIGENSLTKIFLTRSFLGPIFRPLLYSREEYIHYTFLEEITVLTQDIMAMPDLEQRGLTYYWLIEVPKSLFEGLFIIGDHHQKKCNLSDYTNGKEGAGLGYLTQGYILAILPYLMEKDQLDQLIHPAINDLDKLILMMLGPENLIFQYQNHFGQLINDTLKEPINDMISVSYIQQVIDHMEKNSLVSRDESQLTQIRQETIEYFLWKLQNIKISAAAMVRYFKEAGIGKAV
ncbi:hypothetical protein SAMN04515679_4452 [Pelosinus fermentans]|uniref:hypothetical protein n=1 Tax=Pelosinus fermentans TaxID=365349 RepID=UPI0002684AF6|nr:hypothetical protein [Pelosinus fermentans]OAM96257.1 hypothetical protein FR7_04279 [Pelosinus fermentans DSM 17108]SDR38103.1 hypothetical protein SAMN04515679_4452 [Pelosinus fermentans]